MAPFSARDIVRLWEEGARQHPLDRALTILARACPTIGRERLAALIIGQRDALLLQLREETFGRRMDAYAECPECRGKLEFSLDTAEFLSLSGQPAADRFSFKEEGVDVTYRLPGSRDLAASGECTAPEAARAVLLERCLLQSCLDGREVLPIDLPETVIAGIASHMSENDPVGDILLNLDCPACSVGWEQAFDIASFFWTEITVQAKRLLREVHVLARAYGWGEEEILSMSAGRRNYYLEMVEG